MVDLSVIFGTYNRLRYLRGCVESVHRACKGLDYELVIVDGGSTDGTLEWLEEMVRSENAPYEVRLIEHGELRGCVAAYNEGFAAAKGRYVAYLNDDLTVRPGTLKAACDLLDSDDRIGMAALRYSNNGAALTIGYTTIKAGRFLFASFGVIRRELGEQIGWFDGYYHYFGDCHLSLGVLEAGYKIEILGGDYGIDHFGADNAVRGEQPWQTAVNARELARQDGARYRQRWDAWEGPVYG